MPKSLLPFRLLLAGGGSPSISRAWRSQDKSPKVTRKHDLSHLRYYNVWPRLQGACMPGRPVFRTAAFVTVAARSPSRAGSCPTAAPSHSNRPCRDWFLEPDTARLAHPRIRRQARKPKQKPKPQNPLISDPASVPRCGDGGTSYLRQEPGGAGSGS